MISIYLDSQESRNALTPMTQLILLPTDTRKIISQWEIIEDNDFTF